jgi:sugar diacid utilization regulator
VAAPTAATLVERLRGLHLRMVDAVLAGDGLERVAELAAEAVGSTVAIVVPRLGTAVLAPGGTAAVERLPELRRYVADVVQDRIAHTPRGVAVEIPIASGDETVGVVLMLEGSAEASAEASEYLHLAAVASLTEVAVEEARDEVEQNLRGSFLEDLRAGAGLPTDELVRRGARPGCDLSRGAIALCAELHTERPRHVVATITEDVPGALAQHMESSSGGSHGGRVYALLPAAAGDDPADATLASAARLAARLQRHGTVGLSSFYGDPGELARAVQEAELVLDVLTVSGEPIAEDINQGTYRLLFRVLASHPEEVRSFYEDTVAPVVRYDDQYRTDLVGTLEAYLAANCHMSATAAAIHAHRHTVAYRLERVRDLTGLDPMQSEDRERLGLGLKAYRIIAPRLPR